MSKEIDKIIEELSSHPQKLQNVEPRKFEELVAELLASNGYEVQLTPPTGDGGYDIMAVRKDALGLDTTFLIECKRYATPKKVGVSQIRQLHGVKNFLGVSKGILVTTSSFTEGAKKLAQSRYDIQLIDNPQLIEWLKTYTPPPDKKPYSEKLSFHSCFISHSSKDKEFVEKLNGSLRVAGVMVWYAPEDLLPGKKLRDQINKAINSFDKLLIILSKNSMESDWVVTEIRDGRQREKEEGRQVLFPVSLVPMEEVKQWECFDADSGKDLAVEIREYFIPDFSQWQNDQIYRKLFNKLLDGLRADNVPT